MGACSNGGFACATSGATEESGVDYHFLQEQCIS